MSLNLSQHNGEETLKRQGSLRRVVPPNTSGELVVGMSAKMVECPRPSSGNPNAVSQNYRRYVQEYSLIAEYNMLVKCGLPGLYVMPAAYSALVWFCVLFVRKGLYEGGIFRFNLLIPEDFPNGDCPRVVFESKMYHPSIDPVSGETELRSVFPEWRKDINRLWQVLDYVVQMFSSIHTKNALHSDAAHLYETSREEFITRVNESVKLSQEAIYSTPTVDDPHYIKFDQFTSGVHDKVLAALVEHKESVQRVKSRGLSWIQFGSLEPFSASHS